MDSLCILKDKFTGCLFETTFEQHGNGITIKTDYYDLYYVLGDAGVILDMIIPSVYIKESKPLK